MADERPRRLAVLLSGRGSNFEAIAQQVMAGSLAAEIGLVFSNNPDAAGLAKARALGLPCEAISSRGLERSAFDMQVSRLLQERAIDLVCLAGYMRLLTADFVKQFSQRILNIHPSLLPAFPGLDAPYQALVHGAKVSGCTVHFVDENLDSGPIVLQAAVPVLDGDDAETLAARILKEEHRLYPEAIRWYLAGNWRIEGRRVLKT